MKDSFLHNKIKICLILCIGVFFIQSSYAQYFGRNKPSYKAFNFKVYRTPHFEIYHYLTNDSVLNKLAQLSEQWYHMHQSTFRDTFKTRNPIIIYADFADFQQTTAIFSDIDVGTGGVTEPLKNRVIFPIASSYAQTDHVLGHELVHAFQFHTLFETDSLRLNSIRNLPLWMVEGMAEYFSVGSVDANTAMWMRDAIVNNNFPTIEQLSMGSTFFPYRFGQSLMAMIGKTWGDSILVPLLRTTAKLGYQEAIKMKLGFDDKTLSGMWKTALVNQYQKYLDIALTMPAGKKILFAKNAGDMNISPSLSPDGKRIIFLSEKDIFTFDLYLADAQTGRIIRKLSSTVHNNEIDAFNFIESAGTWSSDGKRFVFTIFANGRNKLMLVDVKRGRIIGEYEIPGVPAFSNPAWSPIDDRIVVSGITEGRNNLYMFDLKTKQTTQLTNDNFSYIVPSWSSDGKFLAFATDQPLKKGSPIDPKGGTNLGILNIETKQIELIPVFSGAKNLNPLFSPDNKSLFFLSNRDGFRNLYRYSLDSARVYQMTNYFTGITGITEFSPAISVSRSQELLSYSYYYGGKYSIYSASINEFKPVEVRKDSINFEVATLPPLQGTVTNLVDKQLVNRIEAPLAPKDSFDRIPYRPKFKLDYITNVNAGVATSRFGTGMAGSIFAIFSDISGQNTIATTLAVNGQVYDFGAQLTYLNSKRKINWGVSVSHIPYTDGYQVYPYLDSVQVDGQYSHLINSPLYLIRIFQDQLSFFAYRPLSQTRRIEFGASAGWYYYRIEKWNQYYDVATGYPLGITKDVIKPPAGYNMQSVDIAYVTDNSFFGMTAPMRGGRSRIDLQQYFGTYIYSGILVDYRKYWYAKPYTFAFRALHYGRYGRDAEYSAYSQLGYGNLIYLGYPWYMRGYDIGTFSDSKYVSSDTLSANYNDLFGSKIALLNFEFRFPISGPKRIALIKSNLLLTDLALFCDAGIAWTKNTSPILDLQRTSLKQRIPLISIGASLRFNVLGALVVEPYYAFPMQYGGFKNPNFGVNFLPGW